MFNSSLDAYGAINRSLVGQRAAAIQATGGTVVGTSGTPKVESQAVPMPVDKAALEAAVKKLNEVVAPALQTIMFSVDEETDRVVVKVVDIETQNVLRQIPNEEVLAFSKTLGRLQGLVIRQTA